MPNISVSVDESALEKSGLTPEDVSVVLQRSVALSIEKLRDYYKKDILWNIHDHDLSRLVSNLIVRYLCDVNHGSHPDAPSNNPWDQKTGGLSAKEHESFSNLWSDLNLRMTDGALRKLIKLNTKIKISQFDIDLLLSMIECFMSSEKDEAFLNDLILIRTSLEDL